MKLRSVVAMMALLSAVVFSVGCGSEGNDTATGGDGALSGSISFVGYGGTTQEAQERFWTDPWSKETGVTVSQDGPTDFAKLETQVKTGNVSWDVVHADTFFVQAKCGTLFKRLPKTVDRSALEPWAVTNPCGVPILRYAYLYSYNTEQFKNPPTSWKDFFDTEKYPGKRAVWNYPVSGVLEAALLADGVPRDELYPLDLDRAFRKLESIKDAITFTDPAGTVAGMESKEFAMAMMANGRLLAAAEAGAPYKPVWNDAVLAWDNVAVTEGSSNEDAAFSLVNKIATPEYQDALLQTTPYGGVAKGEPPKLSPLKEKYSAVSPDNLKQSFPIDQAYYTKNVDMITERWNEFVTN